MGIDACKAQRHLHHREIPHADRAMYLEGGGLAVTCAASGIDVRPATDSLARMGELQDAVLGVYLARSDCVAAEGLEVPSKHGAHFGWFHPLHLSPGPSPAWSPSPRVGRA